MKCTEHIHSGPGKQPTVPWGGIAFAIIAALATYLILPH
jgi:hypothetical protein